MMIGRSCVAVGRDDQSRRSVVKCSVLALAVASLFMVPLANAAVPDKTLVFCSEGSPAGFDPTQYANDTDFTANTFTVYNRLVELKRGSITLEPALAESWDISPDGTVYTFHLRHGVQFQATPWFKPTREFNADDVVYSFERMLDPNNAFRKAYPVQYPYLTDLGLDKLITGVQKVDQYAVRFTLREPNAPFILNLTMPFASILSAEYLQHLVATGKASDINQKPVGTGPFIFRSYVKDSTLRFDGNPNYWKSGVVGIGKLIFAITPDASVRAEKMKRGECQVMAYPKPADVDSLRADTKIDVASQPGFNVGTVIYNVAHKPLDNLMVRRALDMAIDKASILKSVYQGSGQAEGNVMPPTQWSYKKEPAAPYDPAKAKSLLAQAGYPNGFELSLWALPVSRPYNPNGKLMAEMIQADWAKIGVKTKLVTYEWGEYIKRLHAGEHDVALAGWTGDNGDPDNWLATQLSCDAVNGSNHSKWCYQPFEKLLTAGRQTSDLEKRTDIYQQAQDIVHEQIPLTPIATSVVYQPVVRDVVDMKIEPLGYFRFDGVSVK
jgi:dipeptide transport system substrate-binding protein